MTEEQLQQLIEKFHVPLHVRRHCAAVAKLAVELGTELQKNGHAVDIQLLRQSALLHDFVRVVDFRVFSPEKFPDPVTEEEISFWTELREKYAGQHHALVGAEILRELGFPKHAAVIEKHRYLQIREGFETWEEKLLFYADKRVKHDQVVPLQERLEDGRKRNMPEAKNAEESAELDKKIFELEQEIFAALKKPVS